MRKVLLLIALAFTCFTAGFWWQADAASQALFVSPLRDAWSAGDPLEAMANVTAYRINLQNAGRSDDDVALAMELEMLLRMISGPDGSELAESMEGVNDQLIILRMDAESYAWRRVCWMFWVSALLWFLTWTRIPWHRRRKQPIFYMG